MFVDMYRKLKKLLRKRKSELDSKQEEELSNTMYRHEKDHILGPFVGLSPEYMEMSESSANMLAVSKKCANIETVRVLIILLFART